jgi:hypothetical protein
MTDQDWEVDGATGGSAAASGETGASPAGDAGSTGSSRSASDPSDPQNAKVVPFPGNWFGSVDELIPIHPEARAPVIELAPETFGPLNGDVAAADASDFWEGDADALEEVSIPAEPQSAIALLRSPGAAKRKPASDRTTAESAASIGGQPVLATHRARRVVAVIAALALASVAVLLATGVLSGRADPGRAEHRGHHAAAAGHHAAPAVTQTITSAAVTVTTKVRARPRHHHKVAQTGTARTTSGPTAANGSASQSSAVNTPPSSSSKSTPASPSHTSATSTSSSSGSGCAAQSPDSGCRP